MSHWHWQKEFLRCIFSGINYTDGMFQTKDFILFCHRQLYKHNATISHSDKKQKHHGIYHYEWKGERLLSDCIELLIMKQVHESLSSPNMTICLVLPINAAGFMSFRCFYHQMQGTQQYLCKYRQTINPYASSLFLCIIYSLLKS